MRAVFIQSTEARHSDKAEQKVQVKRQNSEVLHVQHISASGRRADVVATMFTDFIGLVNDYLQPIRCEETAVCVDGRLVCPGSQFGSQRTIVWMRSVTKTPILNPTTDVHTSMIY